MSYTTTPIERRPAVSARLINLDDEATSLLIMTVEFFPRYAPIAEPSFAANSGVIFTLNDPTMPSALKSTFFSVCPQMRSEASRAPDSIIFSGHTRIPGGISAPLPISQSSLTTAPS